MKVARLYRVRGLVQGVGFRFFVRTAAVRLGLAGWVRNESDGSVLVWAEGDPADLERLERELKHGPPASRVEEVERRDVQPRHLSPPFRIEA